MLMICEKCHKSRKCLHRLVHERHRNCDCEHIDRGCLGKDRRCCHPVGCLLVMWEEEGV